MLPAIARTWRSSDHGFLLLDLDREAGSFPCFKPALKHVYVSKTEALQSLCCLSSSLSAAADKKNRLCLVPFGGLALHRRQRDQPGAFDCPGSVFGKFPNVDYRVTEVSGLFG